MRGLAGHARGAYSLLLEQWRLSDARIHRAGRRLQRVVTQAQADDCCAVSGKHSSTPSPGAFSLSLSAALVTSTLSTLAPIAAPPASFEAWRTHVPLPVGQVPKHVLLSVFLI